MSFTQRDFFLNTLSALVVTGVTLAAVTVSSTPAWSQAKPKAAPAKVAAKQSGDAAYVAGVKAFDSGKTKSAVASLSAALRQGGLPPQKMAKALFYRGSAYRKQGKPAQAISDLTSAIWIKGGLSDADRLAAIEQRKSAYKEAGLGEKIPGNLKPGGGVPSTAVAQSVPVTAPVTKAPSGSATSAWTTTATAQQSQRVANTQAAAPAVSPPSSSFVPSLTPSAPPPSPTLSAMPRGGANPAQTATQPTGPGVGSTLTTIGSSISQGVSNVGSFFGNMFSSNTNSQTSVATPQQPSLISTSSTSRPTNVAQPASSQGVPAVTQGWSSATKPTAKSTQNAVRTAALTQPTAKPKSPPRPVAQAGQFKLQVAAVRSEAKAQQVVAQLRSKYASQLAGAQPEIDAAAIGNMGTFYRVRVGPYVDTKQPRGLCSQLKSDGYDCLIVTP